MELDLFQNDNNERDRIVQLRKELHEHNHRYYVLNQPAIGDMEFDLLMRELQDLLPSGKGKRHRRTPCDRIPDMDRHRLLREPRPHVVFGLSAVPDGRSSPRLHGRKEIHGRRNDHNGRQIRPKDKEKINDEYSAKSYRDSNRSTSRPV